jgi:hypothetical protein
LGEERRRHEGKEVGKKGGRMGRVERERGRKKGMQRMRRNGGRERKEGSWEEGREVARDVVRETNMVIGYELYLRTRAT